MRVTRYGCGLRVDARAKEAAGGEIAYANDVPLTDAQIAQLPFDLYRQGFEYYGKTHVHPNAQARFPVSNLLDLMAFDANAGADLIHQPLLMMAVSRADSLYMTEKTFKDAVNATEKELYVIDGATHIETYWKSPYVQDALEKTTGFFNQTL